MKKGENRRVFSFFFFSFYPFFLSLSFSPPSSCRNNAIYNLTQEEEEKKTPAPSIPFKQFIENNN